ncbi:MAG: homocysteine S-methyltransferase family protein [Candidatus Omnitrophota bacterium]
MECLLDRVKKGEVIVADGAMGSLLMAKVKDDLNGKCPEFINLFHPEVLEEVARLYLDAGAEIIQTNTFGGSSLRLSDYGLQDDMESINRAAVEAVKRVVNGNAYVSASCGPSGKMLQPYGIFSPEQMYDNFYRQLKVLIETGADIICVETMTDIQEATLAVKAARDLSATIPIMATMTFDLKPRGFYTMMGVSIEKAARELEAAGANIIGSNCGNGMENMIKIAAEFRKFTTLPLIIQSNAGLPEIKETAAVYPETPQFMAEKSKELIALGVSVIGGCCGTTPEHIHAISIAVRDSNRSSK